jgi:hypothetical protein
MKTCVAIETVLQENKIVCTVLCLERKVMSLRLAILKEKYFFSKRLQKAARSEKPNN